MHATVRDRPGSAKTRLGRLAAVTNRPAHPALRRAARVLAVTPALVVTTLTASAFADAPDSWETTPAVSPLRAILVYAVFPVALFVVISLLVYLPSMRHRDRSYQPGQAWHAEPEWFGGPRAGAPSVVDGGSSTASGPETGRGGTSGRW